MSGASGFRWYGCRRTSGDEAAEAMPHPLDGPHDEVCETVHTVHKVLQREERSSCGAHHEHSSRPGEPSDNEEECHEGTCCNKKAEGGEPAREAEEEVGAVDVSRYVL